MRDVGQGEYRALRSSGLTAPSISGGHKRSSRFAARAHVTAGTDYCTGHSVRTGSLAYLLRYNIHLHNEYLIAPPEPIPEPKT